MAETIGRDSTREQVNLKAPVFSAPQYQINYGDDHTLQWTPSVGSKELAVALSYYFPLQKDLKGKMQAAIKVFLQQEQQNLFCEMEQVKTSCVENLTTCQQLPTPPTDSSMTSSPESRPATAPMPQIVTWDSQMNEFSPKVKKRRYERAERAKVAANRGFACERHRRHKMKCDPKRCSQNKQGLNGQEALDVASKAEDEFSTGQPTPQCDVLAETNQPVPIQLDDLSLSSFTPSETSLRWSWSSFIDSDKSFSGDFYTSDQYTDLLTPSLSNSSRCHDSIGSVLSETYDLDFLANYDPITMALNKSKRDVSWEQDGDFLHDPFFLVENAVVSSSIHDALPIFASGSGNASAFEVPAPRNYMDRSQEDDDVITTGLILEADLEYAVPIPSVVESTADPAHVLQHEPETLMSWESGHLTNAIPGDFRHGQEIIPLTDVQRETLIKWWGKDRLTEQPDNFCGRSSLDEDRTLSFDCKGTLRGQANLERKNSLVDRVKGAYIPPLLQKGLWRNSSFKMQRK